MSTNARLPVSVEQDLKQDLRATLPRARGAVRLAAGVRDGRTVLRDLFQQGSAKCLLPRHDGPGLTAVLLNTAGGLTGGDRFTYEADAAPGAQVTLATQTPERAYKALPGHVASVETRLTVGAGAVLDWLPQETIFFDGSALHRRLDVDLHGDARFLAVESGILGRVAMGEVVRNLTLSDHWRIRRDGTLIFADAVRITGDPAALSGAAALGGQGTFASILLAGTDADSLLTPLRALLAPYGSASLVRPGVLAARLIAPDRLALRRHLLPALERLRGHALPKTWSI